MFDDRRQSAETDCPEERSRKIDYPRDEGRRMWHYPDDERDSDIAARIQEALRRKGESNP